MSHFVKGRDYKKKVVMNYLEQKIVHVDQLYYPCE